MPSEQDATEFVDESYPTGVTPSTAEGSNWANATEAAPTLNEVDAQVADKQQKLTELRRAQEELERERAALEDTRRRQMEFHKGREEMLQKLTRGIGLLEEAELTARRDAELTAKTLEDFRDALQKVDGLDESTWTKEGFSVELTRALTTLENARMEWNSARVKHSVLAGEILTADAEKNPKAALAEASLAGMSFWRLCKVGLALTWPLLLVGLTILGIAIAILANTPIRR